jgi:hypothetical protein
MFFCFINKSLSSFKCFEDNNWVSSGNSVWSTGFSNEVSNCLIKSLLVKFFKSCWFWSWVFEVFIINLFLYFFFNFCNNGSNFFNESCELIITSISYNSWFTSTFFFCSLFFNYIKDFINKVLSWDIIESSDLFSWNWSFSWFELISVVFSYFNGYINSLWNSFSLFNSIINGISNFWGSFV